MPVGDDGSLPADLADLIADLYDTMDAAYGVGLAANQIGVAAAGVRLRLRRRARQPTRRRGVVVNPVLETSEVPETMPDPDDDDEGCLSVPGESFPTGRATWARVTGPGRRRHADHAGGQRVCSRGCCSTRPDTSTGSSTSTGWSAGMPAPPSAR